MRDDSLRLHLHEHEALVSAAASVAPLEECSADLSLCDGPRPGREGDLALLRVSAENGLRRIGLQNSAGRPVSLYPGDCFVGVLGLRESTEHVLGEVPAGALVRGRRLHLLSAGGVVGTALSVPPSERPAIALDLLGLLSCQGLGVNLSRWRPAPVAAGPLPPALLVAGTATGVGKTTLACRLIHVLARLRGERVGSLMLSGSGGKEDTLAHRAAGAHGFHSFIETGLCCSYGCPGEDYVARIDALCARAAAEGATVLVGELGGDLVWGNNEALLRRARIARDARGLFLVAHDALGALGATRLLDEWGVAAPVRQVVSWTQNHGAMALRYRRLLQAPLLDPADEAALAEAVDGLLVPQPRRKAIGE